MHKVVIITRQNKFNALKFAMNSIGVTGMTVVNVMGCGMQKGASEYYRGVPVDIQLLPKIKVEIVVAKIFVYEINDVIKVRTGESGYDALQDSM